MRQQVGMVPMYAGAAVAAGVTAPVWAPAAEIVAPEIGSFLFRARLASAASDLVAQGTSKGVKNINAIQTMSAYLIGNPFVSTIPGSILNVSYNSINDKNTPIVNTFDAQMVKNITIGTIGNALGNTVSGNVRGGMMKVGAKPNIMQEFFGQQYGHQQATMIDEATNKRK